MHAPECRKTTPRTLSTTPILSASTSPFLMRMLLPAMVCHAVCVGRSPPLSCGCGVRRVESKPTNHLGVKLASTFWAGITLRASPHAARYCSESDSSPLCRLQDNKGASRQSRDCQGIEKSIAHDDAFHAPDVINRNEGREEDLEPVPVCLMHPLILHPDRRGILSRSVAGAWLPIDKQLGAEAGQSAQSKRRGHCGIIRHGMHIHGGTSHKGKAQHLACGGNDCAGKPVSRCYGC